MIGQLPDPLVAVDVDLRGLEFMPLEVARLRDSDLAGIADAEAFRASVLSWCVAWHQVPAGSLPDEDAVLSRLLGYGRDMKTWRRVRDAGGLKGWVKCSDGRLYHPVVAEKANEAWQRRRAFRDRTEKARLTRLQQRQRAKPTHNETERIASSVTVSVTETTGTGTGTEEKKNRGAGAPPSTRRAKGIHRPGYTAKFETFWTGYPKTATANPKAEAFSVFDRLSPEDQDLAIASLPAFDAHCRTQQARGFASYNPPGAVTYLRQRRYEDHAPEPETAAPVDPERVRAGYRAMARAHFRREWHPNWGPAPGEPGCKVPADVIAEVDAEFQTAGNDAVASGSAIA